VGHRSPLRAGAGTAMRIVVTRPRGQSDPLRERLRALGHEVVDCPLIEIEPIDDGPLDTSGYDWVVVTSRNGAELFAWRRTGTLPRVAAIGPGTAAALREHGIEPALVPHTSTQEGLLAELPQPAGRVLVAAAEDARPLLVQKLDADFRALYRTRLLRPPPPRGELVVLASASAARAFVELDVDIPAVTIGPQTSAAARAGGVTILAEASTHDLDGLIAAVEDACSSRF
jgi:uroporphyrinogen III methyltransferase / synthase